MFIETFNNAFEEKYNVSNLHQKAIFANGPKSFIEQSTAEPFYIFPRNGYKFMYSKEVENSNEEYKHTLDNLFDQLGEEDNNASTIVAELLQYTYTSNNLYEGVVSGSEIILYNIPFYYAVRRSAFENYESLLSCLS